MQSSSLASRRLKFRLVFSSLVMLGALLVTWLILADSSPLHNYFLRHGDLPDIWQTTTLIPFLLSAVISGNPHSPSMVIFMFVLIIQWWMFGYVVSIPLTKPWMRRQKM